MTTEPEDVIYLIPAGEGGDWVWCDDPAPGIGMDPSDAIKYVRAESDTQRQAKGPDWWDVIEKGFTPTHVVEAGKDALRALERAGCNDGRAIATTLFQEMLLACSARSGSGWTPCSERLPVAGVPVEVKGDGYQLAATLEDISGDEIDRAYDWDIALDGAWLDGSITPTHWRYKANHKPPENAT